MNLFMKILCNQSLQEKYQEWAQATLDNMINAPIMVLQNPLCLLQKDAECPSGATNKRSINSTRRHPSGFELVDQRVRQCTIILLSAWVQFSYLLTKIKFSFNLFLL